MSIAAVSGAESLSLASAASTPLQSASSQASTVPSTPAMAPATNQQLPPHLSHLPSKALPQNIAHRGYRAKLPENSIKAFAGALAAGAVALETDVHLSKDKVVVLSHDPTLKRCFGRPEKIADCDWSLLETLRTTKDAEVPLARLDDLLAFLSEPGREDVWVLLDIKVSCLR